MAEVSQPEKELNQVQVPAAEQEKLAMTHGEGAHSAAPDAAAKPSEQPHEGAVHTHHIHERQRQGTMMTEKSTRSRYRRESAKSMVSASSARSHYTHIRRGADWDRPAWPDANKYNPRSLLLMSLQNPWRKICIRCIEWKWWDRIVLGMIGINTVMLAAYQPFDTPKFRPVSPQRDVLDLLGKIFSILFALECVVKIMAYGFILGQHTYLHDPWNYLDFFIVIIGILDFMPTSGETGNLSALRSLRVMRPLRAITKFPDLRFLVVLLLHCIPMLSNVLGLCCFIFFVFGILGVQLFQGVLRGVCYNINEGTPHDPSPCTQGGGWAVCPNQHECLLLGQNPEQGVVHFDAIGGSIMSIFQVMTMEGWTDMMYLIQGTYHQATAIYFVVLIFIGPIFAVQLFLVVISTQYAEFKESMRAVETPKIITHTTPPANKQPEQAQTNGIPEEELVVGVPVQSEPHLAHRPSGDMGSSIFDERNLGSTFDVQDDSTRKIGTTVDVKKLGPIQQVRHYLNRFWKILKRMSKKKKSKKQKKTPLQIFLNRMEALASSEAMTNSILAVIILNTLLMAVDHECDICEDAYCPKFKASLEVFNVIFAFVFVVEAVIKILGLGPLEYFTNKVNLFDMVIVIISGMEIENVLLTFECLKNGKTCDDWEACEKGGGGFSVLRTFRLVRIVKLLRAFPDVQKQVKIVIKILGTVAALIALIFIFLLIFCILGMNIFGGNVVEEWDAGSIMLGAAVYVQIPGDTLPDTGFGRYAHVVDVDPFNHSSAPWQVEIIYGNELYPSLGLDQKGRIWTNVIHDVGYGDPAILKVVPRLHYDDLLRAAMTTFQVLTTANWNDDLYNIVPTLGSASSMYFYCIIIVGNWMLLNLFIAILIQGFAEQKANQLQENLKKMQEKFLDAFGNLAHDELAEKMQTMFSEVDDDGSGEIEKKELQKMLTKLEVHITEKELGVLFRQYDADGSGVIEFREFLLLIQDLLKKSQQQIDAAMAHEKITDSTKKEIDTPGASINISQESVFDEAGVAAMAAHDEDRRRQRENQEPVKEPRSLFCLGEQDPLRVACRLLVTNKWFDRFILGCILLSSMCLAIANPELGSDSPTQMILNRIDLFLFAAFLLECLGKIVAQSFLKYVKSGWNKLDLLIVTTNTLDVALTYGLSHQNIDLSVLKIFRIFRILRALRPLRIIARARGLKVLMSTLMSAAKPVLNTLGIALVVFAILGILGMQLLSGKMNYCSDALRHYKKDCVGVDDNGDPRLWKTYEVHFNNIYQAIRSMFILATQDGWPVHMWAGVDATGRLTGPYQNFSPGLMVFYIFSILVAGYLVINIFVGVFVDCYNSVNAAESPNERNEKLTMATIPEVFDDPSDPIRKGIVGVVLTTSFDLFIALLIVTNVLSMAFESFRQAQWQTDMALVANFFFTYAFGWECVFKMAGFYARRYYTSGWNRFDFFIVMISYVGIAVDNLGDSVGLNPTVLRVLRVFRIFRILRAFRIFKAAKGLQAIIATLADSFPALMNLFSMLALVFFIFSILGVTMFGELCTDDDQGLPGLRAVRCVFTDDTAIMDRHASFKGIGMGLLSLFRVATGDAWGEMLNVAQIQPGKRTVNDATWVQVSELLGYTPDKLDEADPNYFTQKDTDAPLRVMKLAVSKWNESVYGLEDDADWPFPESAGDAQSWVLIGRSVMPNCLKDEEMLTLEHAGLADCRTLDGYSRICSTTCGDWVVANLFFCLFVCIAAFVLLQLVIAVLMEQLHVHNDEGNELNQIMVGTQLQRRVFMRMYRRWRYKAAYRIKVEKIISRPGFSQGEGSGEVSQPPGKGSQDFFGGEHSVRGDVLVSNANGMRGADHGNAVGDVTVTSANGVHGMEHSNAVGLGREANGELGGDHSVAVWDSTSANGVNGAEHVNAVSDVPGANGVHVKQQGNAVGEGGEYNSAVSDGVSANGVQGEEHRGRASLEIVNMGEADGVTAVSNNNGSLDVPNTGDDVGVAGAARMSVDLALTNMDDGSFLGGRKI